MILRKANVYHTHQFGIKVDNIAFRYITPKTSKTEFIKEEIELGDFNFLLNK